MKHLHAGSVTITIEVGTNGSTAFIVSYEFIWIRKT